MDAGNFGGSSDDALGSTVNDRLPVLELYRTRVALLHYMGCQLRDISGHYTDSAASGLQRHGVPVVPKCPHTTLFPVLFGSFPVFLGSFPVLRCWAGCDPLSIGAVRSPLNSHSA